MFRGGNNCARFLLKWKNSCRYSLKSNLETQNGDTIEIPNRIHRNPTDILYTLSNTVGNNPTVIPYKYHDDPFLLPLTNASKKTFAITQESGRKAAKWIIEENRKLFNHSEADPKIEAFKPKVLYKDNDNVNETDLSNLIRNSEINDAIIVYENLKSKNMLNPDLQQQMLELICFFNNEETLDEEFFEERSFKQSTNVKQTFRRTWKDGDLAEKIFEEITPKTPASYSAIIAGMCKYSQAERAWAIYQEALAKEITLDLKAYNALLSVVSLLRDNGDSRWDLCQEILRNMNDFQVKPNLGTINSTLSTISSISYHQLAKRAALKTLNECKNLGIEPSLGTWYYVLIIFCRERGPTSHVLMDILNEIENKEFQILDTKDVNFFVTGMNICRYHLHDKTLAERLNNVLNYGSNYHLIGDPNKESIYYRHYFALLCQTDTIHNLMHNYDLYVPNVYIPEPGIMEEIIKAIDTNGALDLIPKIWSDIIIFDHVNRESLIKQILKTMCVNKTTLDDGLAKSFAKVAFEIYTQIQETSERRTQKIQFTANMLGDILMLLCKGDDIENAFVVFNVIEKNQNQLAGVAGHESLEAFINVCVAHKKLNAATLCLKYGVENGINVTELGQRILSEFTLSKNDENKIKKLIQIEE